MCNKFNEYHGGKLSEVVINSLKPFLEKIKLYGIKKTIEDFIPEIRLDEFVLNKIKTQLKKRRGIKLGKYFGMAFVQYRYDGIQIEFSGVSRFLVDKITITDNQILRSFNSILFQIENKYILDDKYLLYKIDEIVFELSKTQIYKPKSSEEKTLYDFAVLILINYYNTSDKIPEWIQPALKNISKGEFIRKWIDILADYISEVISVVTEDIFFDFKVTFDSIVVRTFLNKITNRGQISKLLNTFDIDVKKIIYKFAKSYLSPSFIKGSSEILCDIAGNFLSRCNEKLPEKSSGNEFFPPSPFGITISMGLDNQFQRNFRWFTNLDISECFLEYSYDENFLNSEKIKSVPEKVPKTVPVLNLGLVSSYKVDYLNKYSVTVDNLKIGNVYYRIIYIENGKEIKTPVYKLKLRNTNDNLKFMIFTDSQGMVKTDYESFEKVFDSAIDREKNFDFIVHLGDFVDDGNNEKHWKWVLNSDCWRNNTAVVLAGNHDARKSAVALKSGVENSVVSHFNFKNAPKQNFSKGIYYSFVYSDVTFVVLNTNTSHENGIDKKQYNWAISVLKNAKTKWKIIFTHKSPYSNGPHHKDLDVKNISKQIIDLCYYGEVDLVFAGHDHVYARTPFLIEGEEINNKFKIENFKDENYKNYLNPYGTMFVVPGTSGVKNYSQYFPVDFPYEKLLKVENSVYSSVEIIENKLIFNSYEFDSSERNFLKIDSFSIEKKDYFEKNISSKFVSNFISLIPNIPWINNTEIIKKSILFYESLDYNEKLCVKNYSELLERKKLNDSFKDIQNSEIRVVKNKKEFLNALKNKNVGTIITNCNEIKFGNTITINRSLCITGKARLLNVQFVLLEKSLLVLSGDICIDNNKKPFSFCKSKSLVEMYDYSVFVLNENATINSSYGMGNSGVAINVLGESTRIYLNSSGHNFVSKGLIKSNFSSSNIFINSGKYFSYKNYHTVITEGKIIVKGGFIGSILIGENGNLDLIGGIIGDENERLITAPIEIFGKAELKTGIIKAVKGISVLVHKETNGEISVEENKNIDISGKILYN